jgi:hypothetical protein
MQVALRRSGEASQMDRHDIQLLQSQEYHLSTIQTALWKPSSRYIV